MPKSESFVSHLPRAGSLALAVVGALGLSACAGYMSEPRVVAKTDPAVTYQYDEDADLIQVTQNAEAYCAGFQAWPKTRSILDNADGTKTVVFECERNAPPVMPSPASMTSPAPVPGVSYSVSSDLELVNALRSANAYCRERGMRADASTIGHTGDGSRTVSFRCISA